MPRFRIKAPAAASVALGLLAAAFAAGPAAAAEPGWKMTHKVSIEGEFVNHWTIKDNQPCGPEGDGTVTARFHTTVATVVKPYLDSYAGGGWNVAIPHGYKGHLLKGMKSAKTTGTVTRVDNTTPQPDPFITEPCLPLSKRGCGTFPLKGAALVDGGHRPHRIAARIGANFAFGAGDGCLVGEASTFDGPRRLFGGDNLEGNLLLKMPKPSAFKRRRVVLTGNAHKRSSWGDASIGTSTNDITRKVTVTFKRL